MIKLRKEIEKSVGCECMDAHKGRDFMDAHKGRDFMDAHKGRDFMDAHKGRVRTNRSSFWIVLGGG